MESLKNNDIRVPKAMYEKTSLINGAIQGVFSFTLSVSPFKVIKSPTRTIG